MEKNLPCTLPRSPLPLPPCSLISSKNHDLQQREKERKGLSHIKGGDVKTDKQLSHATNHDLQQREEDDEKALSLLH